MNMIPSDFKASDPIQDSVNEIFELYNQYGNEVYGERVTMLMHMMQAALWAEQKNYSNEMIIAAFLHDIGHFFEHEDKMGDYGTLAHDELGGNYLLKKGFPSRMQALVKSHVAAKRYLTAVEPDYFNDLSEASRQTLVYQGGPMNREEVVKFESEPGFQDFINLRRLDDLGKDENMTVQLSDLERMRGRIIQYLRDQKLVH